MIDNPNPNPIFKMDWQSNPNPITIQQKKFFQVYKFLNTSFQLCNEICKIPRDFPKFMNTINKKWLGFEELQCNFWVKHIKILIFLDLDWIGNVGLTIQIQIHFLKLDCQSQSNKMDCNPDWSIQQSNPAILCTEVNGLG